MSSPKSRYGVIGLITLGIVLIGYLVYSNIGSQQQYYLTLEELDAMAARVDGQGVRINARVMPGTIHKNPGSLDWNFWITDGTRKVSVHYRGAVSDMFQDNVEVVVEGIYDADRKHIEANRLLTKCPSKYQAEKPVNENQVR